MVNELSAFHIDYLVQAGQWQPFAQGQTLEAIVDVGRWCSSASTTELDPGTSVYLS